jgi:Mg-chelatase subunit ChlD
MKINGWSPERTSKKLIPNELFKEKLAYELNNRRGVRIGESTIASTRLHLFNSVKGEVIVVKSKAAGKGSIVHLDTFHSQGYVDRNKILKELEKVLPSDTEIIFQEGSNERKLQHVHTIIKLRPEIYDLIIPAACAIEAAILAEGLELRRINGIKCRNLWFFSSLLIFKRDRGLFGGEFSDISDRVTKIGREISFLVRGGRPGRNETADTLEESKELQRVIRYLRKNRSLLKERADGDKDESRQMSAAFHRDDWIESIDISGTILSLLKKGYWSNKDCEIEDKDIKLNKSPLKDYKNTIFIIDNSQSMRGDSIELVKGVVAGICRKLKGEAAIVTFTNDKAYLYRRFTNNKAKIKESVDKIEIQEVTPLAHGLNVAYEYAARSLRKNINIVLLTDGEPNMPFKSDCPLTDCIEVSALIKKRGFNLCCICTTDEASAVDKIIEAANGVTLNINSLRMQ